MAPPKKKDEKDPFHKLPLSYPPRGMKYHHISISGSGAIPERGSAGLMKKVEVNWRFVNMAADQSPGGH